MGQIVRIEFGYTGGKSSSDILKELSPEQYLALSDIIFDLGKDQKTAYIYGDKLVDSDDLPKLTALGFNYIVKAFKGTLHLGKYGGPETGTVPTHVHVHIPNVGLLLMDEVDVIEDACTEELQKHLDLGWRILCVCPPNSQRRPDYILGRAKAGSNHG